MIKKLKGLRQKYPEFIYQSHKWETFKKGLKIFFDFRISSDIQFKPEIIIRDINQKRIEGLSKETLNNLVFHLGLIEIFSYWKATCSPVIKIKAGSLDKEQIKWWRKLLIRGMGQYFYENKINFKKKDFIRIICDKKRIEDNTKPARLDLDSDKVLVAMGGGKDSVVTLEALKSTEKKILCFSLNPTQATQKTVEIGECEDLIIVNRKIDSKLLRLNKKGFLNGHTPFSAYLAFLSAILAATSDAKFIAFSNERSANEDNVKYLGEMINHQYSKSFEFEKDFLNYSRKHLIKDFYYFSFLRPLYEIQIVKIFSEHKKYFDSFISCNQTFKTYSGTKKLKRKWCGNCPKCLFVFICLYPFLEKREMINIFGQNLFEKKELLSLTKQLIGERGFKPFECVGTKEESLVAFYLGLKKEQAQELPFLLEYFKRNILPKYPNLGKTSTKIMNSWNKKNNLSPVFKKILKSALPGKCYPVKKN